MTIALATTCRQCGHAFTRTPEDVRSDHPGSGGKPRDGPPGAPQGNDGETSNLQRKETDR